MMFRHQQQWHWSVAVVVVTSLWVVASVEGTPLSHQQQLRRRGLARGRSAPEPEEEVVQTETEEPILVEYTPAELNLNNREKNLKDLDKALKDRERELEKIKDAFYEREKVLEEREYALDTRDQELDQRGKSIDKQVLDTDKRLKEREDRIAVREHKLSERESEILKMAEAREQEINRLTLERENAAELREKAIEDRERALDEREKKVEDREIRVQKRMEANRRRFQRRRELHQLNERIGMTSDAPPKPKSKKGHQRAITSVVSSVDQSTQATANHPRRVVEKVTLRKVTSAAPAPVSEATSAAAVYFKDVDDDDRLTTALSPEEQFHVTEAVAYESAKEYAATSSPVKGETTVFQQGLVPVSDNAVVSSSGKKRKSGKRRARQRRQGHHHDGHSSSSTTSSSTTSSSHSPGSGRKHKVRKVVKRMGVDGNMVIISKHDH